MFAAQHKALPALNIEYGNFYGVSGSFARGTGQGHAEPAQIRISVESGDTSAEVADLVRRVVYQWTAVSLLTTPAHKPFVRSIHDRRLGGEVRSAFHAGHRLPRSHH